MECWHIKEKLGGGLDLNILQDGGSWNTTYDILFHCQIKVYKKKKKKKKNELIKGSKEIILIEVKNLSTFDYKLNFNFLSSNTDVLWTYSKCFPSSWWI